MLKSIQNLGKVLTKKEQQEVQGGGIEECLACFRECRQLSLQREELALCFDACQLEFCHF
ncbi:hypothetical protein [Aquimarina rhabdastrellae]